MSEFHRNRSFKDGYLTTCKKCRAEADGRIYRPPAPEGFKRCRQCGKLKPATVEYFSPHKECAGGLHSKCRKCRSEQDRAYRGTNREKVLAGKKVYRQANPEKVRAQILSWVERNRERVKESRRVYYQENRERIRRQTRDNYIAHQETYIQRSRQWRKDNPERFRDQVNDWRRTSPERAKAILIRYRARKHGLTDSLGGDDWQTCLEYWGYRCAVCGREADSEYRLAADHWIPVSHRGVDNPGTTPENIIPLCSGGLGNCNSSKSNKNPLDWLIAKLGQEAAKLKLAEIEAYFECVKSLSNKEQIK